MQFHSSYLPAIIPEDALVSLGNQLWTKGWEAVNRGVNGRKKEPPKVGRETERKTQLFLVHRVISDKFISLKYQVALCFLQYFLIWVLNIL